MIIKQYCHAISHCIKYCILIFFFSFQIFSDNTIDFAKTAKRIPLPDSLHQIIKSGNYLNKLEKDFRFEMHPHTELGDLYLRCNISRCITYGAGLTNEDLILRHKEMISSRVLYKYAILRIQVLAVAKDPSEAGRSLRVNVLNVNSLDGRIVLGSGGLQGIFVTTVAPAAHYSVHSWAPGPSGGYFEIPAELLMYGTPRITPNTSLSDIVSQVCDSAGTVQPQNPLTPIPGENAISLEVVNDSGRIFYKGFSLHVYATLEIRALDPIILIHGTNANHTSWEEGDVSINGLSYFIPVDYMKNVYKGIWFYKIDLTNSNNPLPLKKYYTMHPTDNKGNGGIAMTGREEIREIFVKFLIGVLGSRNFHVIAHSKGGSDCRETIKRLVEDDRNNRLEFKLKSLFTIGTPHLGTILSDIAIMSARHHLMMNWAYWGSRAGPISTDTYWQLQRCLNAAGMLDYINIFANIGPKGSACMNQQLNERLVEYNHEKALDVISRYLQGNFYSIRGDADVNNSGDVSSDEAQVMIPPGVRRYSANAMYQVVGRVQAIEAYSPLWGLIRQVRVRMTPVSGFFMPNDLCTRYDSGLGPGADRFLGRHSFSWPDSEDPVTQTKRREGIDPGNHSVLKNRDSMRVIINKLVEVFNQ